VINATWHKGHPMPAHATPLQRLRWHLAHAKACGCRKLTASMLRELRRRAQKSAAKERPALLMVKRSRAR
jgi:hypothetical protein